MSSWQDSKHQWAFQRHNLESDTQSNTCQSKYIVLWCLWCCTVSHFNYGQKAALDTIRLLGIDPGIYITKFCGSINKKRKHQSIYKILSPEKKRPKILRHSLKKRNDKVVEQEGISYEAGGFWNICFVTELLYIQSWNLPTLLMKGQEPLKFSWPERGVGVEMGRFDSFFIVPAVKK